MTEFQEKLRQQHEDSMHRELEALLNTANKAEAEVRTTAANIPNISSLERLVCIWNTSYPQLIPVVMFPQYEAD